jgi:RNA-dependent RNA polymerase
MKPDLGLQNKNMKLVYIKRAIITPTRVVYYFKQASFSNRVTRQFGQDTFLRVNFRDEDMRKLNQSRDFSDMSALYQRIGVCLKKGLKCCNVLFSFLAMSSSQLREHGCWLVSIDAHAIRKWMGNFSDIRCVGKYAARLGQSLSSSIETFKTDEYDLIEDIVVDQFCFTDGIGKISCKYIFDGMLLLDFSKS